ncbi:MAG TPA: ribbon-helix-helix protein, CopG family [Tepidisphaeraceae bacterium]|nr:ribbon-helix-helix protein, CopG family [Tepidisphaeraceae bacterium]
MGKGEKPILSIRIDARLLERIDQLAELGNVSRAEVVERCLYNGLPRDEEMVQLLESTVRGPIVQLLSHPVLMEALGKVLGEELDPTALKMRDSAIKRRRAGGRAKPATE